MKRLLLLLTLVCTSALAAEQPLTVPPLSKPFAKPAQDDPLQAKYDAAWAKYAETVGSATTEVTKALDAQFEKAADAGNLELADMWDKKKKFFLDSKTLEWPSDGRAKMEWRKTNPKVEFPDDFSEVVASTQEAYAAAIDALKVDYEALVKDYTKARNLERAKQVKEEMTALDKKPAAPPARVRMVEEEKPSLKKEGPPSLDLTKGGLAAHWQLMDPSKGGNWELKDDIVVCTNDGASLVSKRRFSDFELQMDFRLPPRCNSGVYLRGCYEIQLMDSRTAQPLQRTGAVYGQIAPSSDVYRGPNEWNTLAARLEGNVLTVHLNGEKIIDRQELHKPTLGGPCGDPRMGPIMIQSHSEMSGAKFRNILVTPLGKK